MLCGTVVSFGAPISYVPAGMITSLSTGLSLMDSIDGEGEQASQNIMRHPSVEGYQLEIATVFEIANDSKGVDNGLQDLSTELEVWVTNRVLLVPTAKGHPRD